jgi:hypothetical protein
VRSDYSRGTASLGPHYGPDRHPTRSPPQRARDIASGGRTRISRRAIGSTTAKVPVPSSMTRRKTAPSSGSHQGIRRARKGGLQGHCWTCLRRRRRNWPQIRPSSRNADHDHQPIRPVRVIGGYQFRKSHPKHLSPRLPLLPTGRPRQFQSQPASSSDSFPSSSPIGHRQRQPSRWRPFPT